MIPARVSHLEKATQGIADFARQHGGWTFVLRPESYTVSLQGLHAWNGHGVIALIDNESEARAARALSVPVVNLSGALDDVGLPRVMVDHAMVGRVAAEHLLQCGFRRFAYYGIDNLWYAGLRRRGFVSRVEEEGYPCGVFTLDENYRDGQPWHFGRRELEDWLGTLNLPVGILACDDYRARMVVEACSRLELDVPGAVGIVGVDNEELICEFCVPSLSSVSRSNYQVGFQAAALLNRLMLGEAPPMEEILVPPDGVIRRHSTDVVGVADPHVAAAVRYIRENLDKQFGVKHIATQISVSRRCLEQGFRSQLGCTPYEYLSRLRVERAKQMLAGQRRVKISHVARACGFNNPLQLRRAFHRATGTTPQRFRQTL
jgi:LacI family transcriptional regulator